MTFGNKPPDELGKDELMSLALVLRDLNDVLSDKSSANIVAVKTYEGSNDQPYYAVRERVNRARQEVLDYLLAQGIIDDYVMLPFNADKLDYTVTINKVEFASYFDKVIRLNVPNALELIDSQARSSYSPRKTRKLNTQAFSKPAKVQATLDFNGFNIPIVYVGNTAYVMPKIRSGKSNDVVSYCLKHAGEVLSISAVKKGLKAEGKNTYMGLTNFNQALRRSLYEKGEGPLGIFVTVSPTDIMIETSALTTQNEIDSIISASKRAKQART